MEEKIAIAQKWLQENGMKGWLLYDWAGNNRLALGFFELPEGESYSRRVFYWIPAHGEPVAFVHAIEAAFAMKNLPGKRIVYKSQTTLIEALTESLPSSGKVAMEYSPKNALPYVSKVDGGTIDQIRALGLEVVSSARLIQKFCGILDAKAVSEHRISMEVVEGGLRRALDYLATHEEPTEWQLQKEITDYFEANNCITLHPPIVAVGPNAANPHYYPSEEKCAVIRPGDLLLIDLFCRKAHAGGIYADITNCFVVGREPTERQLEIFGIVHRAQAAGLKLIEERTEAGLEVLGFEVDAVVRSVIEEAGYGEYFTHRTGHHIEAKLHGDGAHLDSVESHDNRPLLAGTCFSVEPGIYIPGEIGVRLEVDVVISPDGKMEVTGGYQEALPTAPAGAVT